MPLPLEKGFGPLSHSQFSSFNLLTEDSGLLRQFVAREGESRMGSRKISLTRMLATGIFLAGLAHLFLSWVPL